MKNGNVVDGVQNAPHRSLFHALGLTDEEQHRPLIGIVSSYNEIVPGHMNLDKITDAVKLGVAMAGGTPIVFPAIAVCDGIAMGHQGMKYSLVTRDLIADSTEAMALAHGFDGLVMIPNCDKNVPGLLMAAARVNIPTVFVSGGPMLAGRVGGQKTSLSSMFEAVGAYHAGKIDDAELHEYECRTCPTCGSCSGMYTANSMNCLTEALGMGLRGNGTIPAVYSARIELAKHAGMAVMELVRKQICPRDIMTKEALCNALTVDMALGCSTNSMLHLPAIAHECGVELDLDLANAISERTPNLCHLAPAGRTSLEDLQEAGGVYAVMHELNKKGLLHTECLTVTGKTIGENIEGCENLDTNVIRPIDNPYSETGGIAVLKGNLAPE
ncbi:MAG: dihydroxy-acid dehydratase, partial [Oscillospiraceae bacterium]|nr:dihydroxy-acid dehydratase [Oscillospiraceae bacterium]